MPEFSDAQAVDSYWQAEYEFYHKIITDEVERLRFNDGYEPVEVDLYPVTLPNCPAFAGKCKIGHQTFRAIAHWKVDAEGKKVLRVQIRLQTK